MEYPSKPELIGQRVKYLAGYSNEKTDNEGKRLKLYADGTIIDQEFSPSRDEFMITVEFSRYRMFREFKLRKRMELPLKSVEFEGGYKFK